MLLLLGGTLEKTGELCISSKTVCAKVKLRQYISRRETFISVIIVYAPSCNSPQEQKDKFYDDLQQAVDSVPADYLLLALGAINARVGCSCTEMEKINREV